VPAAPVASATGRCAVSSGGKCDRPVGSQPERRLAVPAEPEHRQPPGRAIVAKAGNVAPQDLARPFGERARKGIVEPHVAVLDEVPDLGVVESLSAARHRTRMSAHYGNSRVLIRPKMPVANRISSVNVR
jgi:hypothetical protein